MPHVINLMIISQITGKSFLITILIAVIAIFIVIIVVVHAIIVSSFFFLFSCGHETL